MKYICLIMLLSLLGCAQKPEGEFKYYEYRSTTMREYPREYYRLERTPENGLTLSWAQHNSPVTVIRVPEEAAEKLTSIILNHRLYTLKHGYTPPFDVRDGIMWHVYFCFEKGDCSCSSDNAWPPALLRNGIEKANAYFCELISASAEEDILEVKARD
ncbi:MAG: hypothetical protein IK031_04435 [Bacteroidales bacterium]|nr:hypothetical protein [Bacteroidales bacterium]